jgi:hypothetical protein
VAAAIGVAAAGRANSSESLRCAARCDAVRSQRSFDGVFERARGYPLVATGAVDDAGLPTLGDGVEADSGGGGRMTAATIAMTQTMLAWDEGRDRHFPVGRVAARERLVRSMAS